MEEYKYLQGIAGEIIDFIVRYSFQIVGAVVILLAGIFIARWVSRMIINLGERKGLDVTLVRFFGQLGKVIVLAFVLIIVVGKFGISIAPFIAAIGALAFGASFAIQGPLSNYGAGLIIILTRPFVVGNTIYVKGVGGEVEEVSLSSTVLINEDKEKITIPNKHIIGEILTNSFANRIVESTVGISYDDDPEKAIDLIKEILAGYSEIAKEPPPMVGIEAYGDSSINIGMRYWVPTGNYYKLQYSVNLDVYKQLKEAGISIPFPQRDVHLISPES